MLIDQRGLCVDGVRCGIDYKIIVTNDTVPWYGLKGYIEEIRSENDKDTDNDGVDFICDFEDDRSSVIPEVNIHPFYGKDYDTENFPLQCIIMGIEDFKILKPMIHYVHYVPNLKGVE